MKKIILLLFLLCIGTNLKAQVINFADANFKSRLLQASPTVGVALDFSNNFVTIDTNNDGEIQVSEAALIRSLDISESNINSLVGINYFSNLLYLICYSNNISSFDLTGLTNLTHLDFSYNIFTGFNLNYLTTLQWLDFSGNPLTSFNLGSYPNLTMLQCVETGLTSIDLSGVPNLTDLYCGYNNLTTIDLSPVPQLFWLGIESNNFTTIDLTPLTALVNFVADNNQFATIDCNNLQNLQTVFCRNNPNLTNLYLKNAINEYEVSFNNCPNLQYICCDESQINSMQYIVDQSGYTNCYVGTYCTFGPGGANYFINGIVKLDSNANGCDVNDIPLNNAKFFVSNGTNSGVFLADHTGNYSIPLMSGSSVINPVLENPSYFTVSPTSYSASFPSQSSPVTQNFCFTPNGVHSDLEVIIIPIGIAAPGFDSHYKMIYKNKGNVTCSGNVVLSYNDSVLDFVSSTPSNAVVATNSVSWDYSNLAPFEVREVLITFNLNSPMETPPLNSGSTLPYTVAIYPIENDDYANDNIATLSQTVINSFDPNDKTCLEGATITPEKIGDYVHYLIRFENTGTANAQNIVVKDIIDTTKFDISSMFPVDGSHPFFTRITNTNRVEFIFENIQLPFDDANNDGYLVFKIKTKPTLVEGNTFSNTASIYFDYNFPIVTNTATTTIQALANPDFEFSTYFELAPNPTENSLNIRTKSSIELSSISIYNTIGQLVLVIPNAKETSSIDVSQLTSGTYFIKVVSDHGSSNSKFIKG